MRPSSEQIRQWQTHQDCFATVGIGAGTGTAYFNYNKAEATLSGAKTTRDSYGLAYGVNVAKGLFVEPEIAYVNTNTAGVTTSSTTAYLLIERDF